LIPGNNLLGLPQAFLFERVKSDDPVLGPGNCLVSEGCCSEDNGCYTDLRGKRLKAPKRNDGSIDADCIEGSADCHLPVRVLKAKRLGKPAGDQVVKLIAGPIQGFGLDFDPRADGVVVFAEGTSGLLWHASIAASDDTWSQRGGTVIWKAPAGGHPDGLKSLKVGLPGEEFRLRVLAKGTDASALVGADAATVRLQIGAAEWIGAVTCISAGGGDKTICREDF
jgi:hypothetical protein